MWKIIHFTHYGDIFWLLLVIMLGSYWLTTSSLHGRRMSEREGRSVHLPLKYIIIMVQKAVACDT